MKPDKFSAGMAISMLISILVERLEERIENGDLADSPISTLREELDKLELEAKDARDKFEAMSKEDQAETLVGMQESVLNIVKSITMTPTDVVELDTGLTLDDSKPEKGTLQ